MEINRDKRLETYKQSSDVVKELYGSTETGRIIGAVEKKVGIDTEDLSTVFALVIGDVILGLYKKSFLPQLLKDRVGLDDNSISVVVTELEPLLTLIPEIQEESQPSVIPNVTNTSNVTPREPERTAPIPEFVAVKPMRTFSDDVNASRAHGYGAFRPQDQDDDPDEPVHRSNQNDLLDRRT